MDENQLVSQLKQGDEHAFRILFRKYHQSVFRVAYGITLDPEDSQEITQEVFIRVFERIDSFRQQSRLSTWLHRITVNISLNWIRRLKRRFKWHHRSTDEDGKDLIHQMGTDAASPERLYHQKEMTSILWQRLEKLPEKDRAVLILRDVEGLSYDEIANVLQIKRGTVNSRIFYARKKLRDALAPYKEDD